MLLFLGVRSKEDVRISVGEFGEYDFVKRHGHYCTHFLGKEDHFFTGTFEEAVQKCSEEGSCTGVEDKNAPRVGCGQNTNEWRLCHEYVQNHYLKDQFDQFCAYKKENAVQNFYDDREVKLAYLAMEKRARALEAAAGLEVQSSEFWETAKARTTRGRHID